MGFSEDMGKEHALLPTFVEKHKELWRDVEAAIAEAMRPCKFGVTKIPPGVGMDYMEDERAYPPQTEYRDVVGVVKSKTAHNIGGVVDNYLICIIDELGNEHALINLNLYNLCLLADMLQNKTT